MRFLHNFRLAITVLILMSITGCASERFLQTDTGHAFVSNEILVLDPPEDYLRHLPELNLEVADITTLEYLGHRIYHLRITDNTHPFQAIDNHKSRFSNVIVDAHHHFEHHAVDAAARYIPRSAANWSAKDATCGAGIRIGIVDTAVDVNHPALADSGVIHRGFHPKGAKSAKSSHGTSVAAIIGGQGHWAGLLPGAELVTADTFHRGKNGKTRGSVVSILRAVDWLIQKKVSVINLSMGGGKNKFLAKAIEHAKARGIIVIASSGNGGAFSKKKSFPGAYPSVIAVTAVDRFNYSPNFATTGDYIEFAAPGVDIWTAGPDGAGKAVSGTSFAAPFVTAYAAAAWLYHDIRTVEKLRDYLRKHAWDRGEPGRDRYTGWGIVRLPSPC